MSVSSQTTTIDRDASNYEGSIHLRRRVRERTMLTYELVQEAIEKGKVAKRDKDGIIIHYKWLNSIIAVVVTREKTVKTAYEVDE